MFLRFLPSTLMHQDEDLDLASFSGSTQAGRNSTSALSNSDLLLSLQDRNIEDSSPADSSLDGDNLISFEDALGQEGAWWSDSPAAAANDTAASSTAVIPLQDHPDLASAPEVQATEAPAMAGTPPLYNPQEPHYRGTINQTLGDKGYDTESWSSLQEQHPGVYSAVMSATGYGEEPLSGEIVHPDGMTQSTDEFVTEMRGRLGQSLAPTSENIGAYKDEVISRIDPEYGYNSTRLFGDASSEDLVQQLGELEPSAGLASYQHALLETATARLADGDLSQAQVDALSDSVESAFADGNISREDFKSLPYGAQADLRELFPDLPLDHGWERELITETPGSNMMGPTGKTKTYAQTDRQLRKEYSTLSDEAKEYIDSSAAKQDGFDPSTDTITEADFRRMPLLYRLEVARAFPTLGSTWEGTVGGAVTQGGSIPALTGQDRFLNVMEETKDEIEENTPGVETLYIHGYDTTGSNGGGMMGPTGRPSAEQAYNPVTGRVYTPDFEAEEMGQLIFDVASNLVDPVQVVSFAGKTAIRAVKKLGKLAGSAKIFSGTMTSMMDDLAGVAASLNPSSRIADDIAQGAVTSSIDDIAQGAVTSSIDDIAQEAVTTSADDIAQAGATVSGDDLVQVSTRLDQAAAEASQVAPTQPASLAEPTMLRDGAVDLTTHRTTEAERAGFRAEFENRYGWRRFQDSLDDIDFRRSNDAILSEATKDIPDEDLVALYAYTQSDLHGNLNHALRSQNPALLAQESNNIRATASGLNQLPAYQGTSYRGVTMNNADIARYQLGETIIERGFTSTSQTSPFPGNVRMTFEGSTGRDISALSEYPHEAEVLFGPGTPFEVTYFEKKGKFTYIHLREVTANG